MESKWELEPVIKLLESGAFRTPFMSSQDLSMKRISLVGLAMGTRVSFFVSLLRGKKFINLFTGDEMSNV